jgi:hypothetical protein
MFNTFDPMPSRIRTVELENGNILRLEAKDPYGFVYLSLEHGQLPDHLKGAAFTDWHQAEMAAKKYQDARKMAIAEVTVEEAPKAKKK